MRLVGGVVLGAVALTACSASASVGGASLDQESVEAEIERDLTEFAGVAPEAIDCTGIADIEVDEGNTFTCTGTAPNGEQFDIEVTLTDDEGGFTAVVPG